MTKDDQPAADGAIEPAELTFSPEGVPASPRYGDIYHPAEGGIGQAVHVFLGGNGLPGRWHARDSFVIVETGFGTGLNFLCTWAAWRDHAPAGARLHYVAVEKHPFAAADLARIHERWPQFAGCSPALRGAWPALLPGFHRLHFEGERITLTLLFGDAVRMLARLGARADAFFLDGFAPARNPGMWSAPLCRELARLAAPPGATLATWSVAGSVRANLAAAGFVLERRPGFGHKREMLTGVYAGYAGPASARGEVAERHAMIIGAGMAGTCCAQRLAARGWQVEILERHDAPAREASGNPAAVLLPLVNLADTPAARLSRAALLYAARHLDRLRAAGLPVRWARSGVLQLAREDLDPQRHERALAHQRFPADFASNVDISQASDLARARVAAGGWWFPAAGWLAPADVCEANLRCDPQHLLARYGRPVARLAYEAPGWIALDAGGEAIARAPVVVIASAMDVLRLAPQCALPLTAARGQVSFLPQRAGRTLAVPVCRRGYITPARDGIHDVGASFDYDEDPRARAADHRINLDRLEAMLPGFAQEADPRRLDGRVSFRATTPDRLPVLGPLCGSGARDVEPVWACTGLGARGMVWAALLAELLASRIAHEPLPVETGLAAAINPDRFARRRTQ